jgi:hypothetical protein
MLSSTEAIAFNVLLALLPCPELPDRSLQLVSGPVNGLDYKQSALAEMLWPPFIPNIQELRKEPSRQPASNAARQRYPL